MYWQKRGQKYFWKRLVSMKWTVVSITVPRTKCLSHSKMFEFLFKHRLNWWWEKKMKRLDREVFAISKKSFRLAMTKSFYFAFGQPCQKRHFSIFQRGNAHSPWLRKKSGFMKMTFLPSLAAPIVFGTFWKIHSSIDSSAENTPFLLNMQLFLIALILSALTRTFASSCAKMVYRTTMKTSFLSSNALICYAG